MLVVGVWVRELVKFFATILTIVTFGYYFFAGRRAFDRHFQEARHASGMRCLRIPNTKYVLNLHTPVTVFFRLV